MTDQADLAAAVDRLASKDAIRELMYSYARGIDRCDVDRLHSIYWPDATDDHGFFVGNAIEFADTVVPQLKDSMHRTMHNITNISVEFESEDVARSETWCIALHEFDGESGVEELFVGGRYLDRVERREGEWRIAQRVSMIDWNQTRCSTSDWSGDHPLIGSLATGARKPDDISYTHGW